MNAIESLRNRRTRLLIEAALQRERMGHDLRTLQAPLSVVDHGVDALRWLNKHRLTPNVLIRKIRTIHHQLVNTWRNCMIIAKNKIIMHQTGRRTYCILTFI